MPNHKCNGWHTKNGVMGEEKSLEAIAKAAADFPDYAAGESWTLPDARAIAEKDARTKAEGWCRKRACPEGKCHLLDVETQLLDKSETTIREAEGEWPASKFYSVKLKITAIRCACRDTNIIIVRPEDSERPKPISFKAEMEAVELTAAQIEKISKSKCVLLEFSEVKKEGEAEKRLIWLKCDSGIGEHCETGKSCALVLYKIGDDTDAGAVQKTPYDLSTLKPGFYLSCECR